MFDSLRSKLFAGSAVLSTALVATPAFAQSATAIDVSSVIDGFSDVGVAVAAIGVAMIAAIAAGIAYRWIVAYLAK